MAFEGVPGWHVLEREEFAAAQPYAPLDEGPRMHVQRHGLTAIGDADQLERLE